MLICHIFCHVTVFAGVENLPRNTKADWTGHQERGGVVGRNQNSFNALYKKWVAKETEQHTLRGYKPTQGRIKQPNECPQPSLYSIKSPYKLPWQILSAFFISKGDDAWHVLNAWMGEGGGETEGGGTQREWTLLWFYFLTVFAHHFISVSRLNEMRGVKY